MYLADSNFSTCVQNGNRQDVFIDFDTQTIRAEQITSDGLSYEAKFNGETDVQLGLCPSYSCSFSLINYDRSWSSFAFGWAWVYVGVLGTTSGAATAPYISWTDNSLTSHYCMGSGYTLKIDGVDVTQHSTSTVQFIRVWPHIGDKGKVFVYYADGTIETYTYASSAWTSTESTSTETFPSGAECLGIKYRQYAYIGEEAETWYTVPLGYFNFETPVKRQTDVIEVSGYDRMCLLEKDSNDFLSSFTFTSSTTAESLFEGLMANCGITDYATMSECGTLSVTTLPEFQSGLTCQQILKCIAELTFRNAYFNREGRLVFRRLNDASSGTASVSKSNIKIDAYDIAEYQAPQVNGVIFNLNNGNQAKKGSTPYVTTSGNVFFDMEANAQFQDDIRTAYKDRIGLIGAYTPYSVTVFNADPCVEAGDKIAITDGSTTELSSYIFNIEYKWAGTSMASYEATGNKNRDTVQDNSVYVSTNSPLRVVNASGALTTEGLTFNQSANWYYDAGGWMNCGSYVYLNIAIHCLLTPTTGTYPISGLPEAQLDTPMACMIQDGAQTDGPVGAYVNSNGQVWVRGLVSNYVYQVKISGWYLRA